MRLLYWKRTKNAVRRVLDVRAPHSQKPQPVGRAYFDYSHESEREIRLGNKKIRFFLSKPVLLTSVSVTLIMTLFIYTAGLTRADVQQFYAGKCLGSWQNPRFAEGITETTVGTSSFSNENSATLTPSVSSSEQIFCGGFLPPDYEAKGVIDHIGLSFVWHLEFPPLKVASSSEDMATTTIISSTTTTDSVATTTMNIPTGSSTEESGLAPAAWLLHYLFPSVMAEGEEAVEPAVQNVLAPTETAPKEDQVSSDGQEAILETSTTETISDSSGADSSITTPEIIADEGATTTNEDALATTSIEIVSSTISEADVATETTTTIEESIDENTGGEVLGASSGEDISTTLVMATSTATSTEIADDIDPADGFLLVRYSLDGANWFNLGQVNRDNWPDFTVSLPITSWEEVENLQISITEVAGTEDRAEVVYFDGAIIEVHFDLPTFLGDVLPDVPVSKTIESLADTLNVFTGNDDQVEVTEESVSEKISVEEPVILTREAKQRCKVLPFTGAVKRGGEVEHTLTLWPSGEAISSALNPGAMPKGLNVRFGADSIGNEMQEVPLYIFADKDARQGSFNVSVLYKESYGDGYVSITSCKFNPVIE